ncbi:DNA repair protein RecN [Candidatus Nitrosacidococcus tergens]|uniref:DNA repair protein RecN n=1 Tax=Candidatus Nitrosacidococcus tergens TaxID=553981 RepID=A0A7G1QAN6_9GAMM|nr:DNA repair protein RecN [Candidatus Nitrosacidococcus tergens]CAB1276474.1 DNA repair protein RecN [Candidatus Nitrosacidococcus tergens]
MIKELFIRNFIIVRELTISLHSGMTALTGETGAGKSILIDALELVLGGKGDTKLIYQGEKETEIKVIFKISGYTSLFSWLETQKSKIEIKQSNLILRRILNNKGRSQAYINDQPVSIKALREIGEYLVYIYGQNSHQSLLKIKIQRGIVDIYGSHESILRDLSIIYQDYRSLIEELIKLNQAIQGKNSRIELLHYQLQELNHFQPNTEELKSLEQERKQSFNLVELVQTSEEILNTLYQEDQISISALLEQVHKRLTRLSSLDPILKEIENLVTTAAIQIDEATSQLGHYLTSIDGDPNRLAWIEDRLSGYYELGRKHQIAPENLPHLVGQIKAELASLENIDAQIDQIKTKLTTVTKKYLSLATTLSQSRYKAAAEFSKKLNEILPSLALTEGVFHIKFAPVKNEELSSYGMDQIQFQASLNPGQPLQLLNTISGGELSRIGFAIQTLISEKKEYSSLIFDEVDTGIGGLIADTIGARLRELATHKQVLCITHLPQIAAQAHHQIRINKYYTDKKTTVDLVELNKEQRVEELARMFGGKEVTKQSRAHAVTMLETAQ